MKGSLVGNKTTLSRRGLLRGAAATGALVWAGAAPTILRAQETPLKVGVYGGYFKDSFDANVFPDFTAATGIAVESVAEPTGEAWLIQLQQAAQAGEAPADVSMMATVGVIRGTKTGLWLPFDESKMPNAAKVRPDLLHRDAEGKLVAVGAVTWFVTLVSNTEVYPEAPTSWADMWDPKYADSLGLLALVSNSYLLEVTAKTFFGGVDYLSSDEKIMEVLAKVAELKPNVRLWYRDEAQFEQALKTGEIPMGQYYHDVTGLAIADGFPVRSIFPKEGGIRDSGSWAITKASKMLDQGQVFIDYMSQPEIQAKMSRVVGTSPTVPRELTDLSDDEFNAVSSDIDPVVPKYDLHAARTDWLNQIWAEMQQS